MTDIKTGPHLYHERQVRELCAVHALNNLFQAKVFLKQDLDGICTELSPSEWLNPHRSILGLGNYDINVLMKALQSKDCEAEWFDKRKDPVSIEISDSRIVGFIMNVPTEYKIGFVSLPLQRRHWISIRRAGNDYYSFDSKLKDPIKIGSDEELINHLRAQLDCKNKELFIVRRSVTDPTNASPGATSPGSGNENKN